MRTLVVSDTHGHDRNLKEVLEKEGPFDCVIHLGDSNCTEEYLWSLVKNPVHMVAGNCDFFTNLPRVKIVELDGTRILITHGHYHYVNVRTDDLAADARANGCTVAMYGHTHRPHLDESAADLTIVNPGSLSQPRQENRRPSYAVMETREGKRPQFEFFYL